jgi:hypothetical protein
MNTFTDTLKKTSGGVGKGVGGITKGVAKGLQDGGNAIGQGLPGGHDGNIPSRDNVDRTSKAINDPMKVATSNTSRTATNTARQEQTPRQRVVEQAVYLAVSHLVSPQYLHQQRTLPNLVPLSPATPHSLASRSGRKSPNQGSIWGPM